MFRFTDLIIFRMTRDCNLNCSYCFMHNKAEHKGELIDFELYKKIVTRIVEQRVLNYRRDYLLNFVLHGGEVLLLGNKRLYQMLEFTKNIFVEFGIPHAISCQTNATLLTEEIARTFNKFEVNIGLSFDGVGKSNAARTDLKQEVFDKKFAMLNETQSKYGFIIVAGKNNVDKIQESQRYLEDLGLDDNTRSIVKGYKINYAEDMVNPGEDSDIELTGKELFERVWKPELDRFLETGKTVEYHTLEMLRKSLVDVLAYHSVETRSGCGTKWCGAGITMIAIEPDGEMDYCDRYSKKFDDVYVQHALDYDFLGIHQLKRVLEYNKMKDGVYKQYDCDTCIADYICDHGCESFYRSKYGEYGIDTRIVCDQHIDFYSYILTNIKKFMQLYAKSGQPIVSYDTLFDVKDWWRDDDEFELSIDRDSNSIIIKERKDGNV